MSLKRISEFITEVFQELLTDEEVDGLIILYSSPAYHRFMTLMPEIAQKMAIFVEEQAEHLGRELEQLAEEVMDEFEAKENNYPQK